MIFYIWFFRTPGTAACQASLYITNSQSLLKLMSIESVMPCNHLILCHLLFLLPSIFPSISVFSNEFTLHIRWPSIGASASDFPVNIQSWFPLRLTGFDTCKISCMKRDASPGSMHDTGCLGLVHWDDPEGWYGEGGGFRMGSTCIPVMDSFWYLAKLIQLCKV